jgi:L-ascorbate metabolism protein UlaG (beta-lactamase superfamily)
MKTIILSIFLFTITLRCLSQPIEITYTGNMGAMIRSGEAQILIDGLHLPYGEDYLPPPSALLDSLVHSKGQYKLNLLLFTHRHNDHFNEAPVNAFLQSNKHGKALAPGQACEKIDPKYKSRLMAAEQTPAYRLSERVSVKPVRIAHSGPQRHSAIDNFAYVIEAGDKKILHLGDADCSEEALKKSGLASLSFDAAIVPSWYFSDTGSLLTVKYIRARKFIITHISPLSNPFTEQVKKNKEKVKADGVLFREIGERVVID